MQITDLPNIVPKFAALPHVQKIKIFAWYLHTHSKKEYFVSSDIRECYNKLSLELPSNISQFLKSLETKRPKEMLHSGRGYSLERRVMDDLQNRYGQRASTVQVHQLLEQLPKRISNVAEKNFFSEALICLKNNAPRAAIVMTWNLAFDHLCEYVFSQHLVQFNAQWPIRFPGQHKNGTKTITKKDDFTDFLKESEIIEICNSANIITGSVFKILKGKLDIRNTAAHPNAAIFTILQAEEFITDLVNNVVLVL
jgi:hypothetical protein